MGYLGNGCGNWAIFYVQVEDVHAAIDRAQQLGATLVVPLIDNGAIEFAHLADPLGNRFGIWRPKSRSVNPTGSRPGFAAFHELDKSVRTGP